MAVTDRCEMTLRTFLPHVSMFSTLACASISVSTCECHNFQRITSFSSPFLFLKFGGDWHISSTFLQIPFPTFNADTPLGGEIKFPTTYNMITVGMLQQVLEKFLYLLRGKNVMWKFQETHLNTWKRMTSLMGSGCRRRNTQTSFGHRRGSINDRVRVSCERFPVDISKKGHCNNNQKHIRNEHTIRMEISNQLRKNDNIFFTLKITNCWFW